MNPSNLLSVALRFLAKLYPASKRWLHRFHGGVFPQYYKSLSATQPIRKAFIPEKLILPLEQPVGLPAETLVKVGERVKKNQLLAQASKDPQKALIVPVHAPTSGTVMAIQPMTLPHPSGLQDQCIVLQPDGLDEAIVNALEVDGSHPGSPEALKSTLLHAGIVGMGGAGFPTYAKIPNQRGKIHTLLINGAECEPFITCDDLLMQTRAQEIVQGALITAHALGASKIICGIETNKPEAIRAMQEAASNTPVEIRSVETVYPMGGQKQLTLELTGVEMPHKAHAVDLGLLMMNVATYAAIYRAVVHGEPLTSRLVTVSGLGLNKPFNIHALIGTPFSALAELAEPKVTLDYPLVMGGPMMGFQVQNNDVPVIKTTNCILANPPEPVAMQMPCIRCGECMQACPVNLLPQQMYWHTQAHEYDKVEKLNVFDCIECGCCSYVCPSHIPLVQYYRHAKSEIKAMHAEEKATELAKQRHEFKLARIEREKREREARLKAKKEAVKKEALAEESPSAKKPEATAKSAAEAARAAAAKRAAAQKQSQKSDDSNNPPIPPARLKAIEAAKKAAAQKAQQKNEESSASSKVNREPPKSEPDEKKPDAKSAAKAAAMKAAQKRTQAKKQASTESASEVTSAKRDARQRAIEAAKKRAAAKKAELQPMAEMETEQACSDSAFPQQADVKDNTTAATELTETTTSTPASEKETARRAAIKAAKEAAAKRKAASPSKTEQTENTATPKPDEDKRKKAIEAARNRAAQKRNAANESQQGDK